MRYSKVFEVREDTDRVYFSFFANDTSQRIIAIPKKDAINQAVYAGTSYGALHLVEKEQAKTLLTHLMRRTVALHPAANLCSQESLRLLD